MPKSHPSCQAEFWKQIIDLLRPGRTPESPAQEFEPSAQSIRN